MIDGPLGWQSVLTSLPSLHIMTKWHMWAEILDGRDDFGCIGCEQRASRSLSCVLPSTFWRNRPLLHKTQCISVGQISFHYALQPRLPSIYTHILLCWSFSLWKSRIYNCLLLSWASSPSGYYCFCFLQYISMESFHFPFLICCLLECRECNKVYNIVYSNWLYNLSIKYLTRLFQN